MTVDEIVSLAGGVTKLADLMGVDHSTVSGWKRDGRVPPERALIIHELMDIALQEIPWRRTEAGEAA